MENTKTYRLEVSEDVWNKFRAYLRKVYWEEDVTVNEGVVRLIKKFIEENENGK